MLSAAGVDRSMLAARGRGRIVRAQLDGCRCRPTATTPADLVRSSPTAPAAATPAPAAGPTSSSTRPAARSVDASGAEPHTTNNRMELTGAIEGLASLKRRCRVELVTDSQYVGKGIPEWMPKWKAQGWQRKEGKAGSSRS